MTLKDAKKLAQVEANKTKLVLALCIEGPHADEFAELDADGNSYGYCPYNAASYLYKHGQIIETIVPAKK